LLVTFLVSGLVWFSACQHEPYYLEHLVGYGDDGFLVSLSMFDAFMEALAFECQG